MEALHYLQVKRYKNGFINDPLTMSTEAKVKDIRQVKVEKGFSGIPITESGKIGSKLLGMVCTRDIDFVGDDDLSVTEVMTRELVVAKEGCTLSQANVSPAFQFSESACACGHRKMANPKSISSRR